MRQEGTCIFSSSILCQLHQCQGCGWAPREKARRLAILREKGIHALEPTKKSKGRPTQISDEEAKDFIRKNCRAYGGEMTVAQIMRAVHMRADRFYRLRREIDEEYAGAEAETE